MSPTPPTPNSPGSPATPGSPASTDAGEPITFDVADPFLFALTADDSDLDGQGHVNNAAYLRWMDRAAYAHSAAVGYDREAYARLGATFVVRRHEIDYLVPAYAGDRIIVATWPRQMSKATALRRHQIVRAGDGITLARAMTTWVFIDPRTGRPRRMPQAMIRAFNPRDDQQR